MARRAQQQAEKPNGLVEIEVTPDQARFLIDMNRQAKAAAAEAKAVEERAMEKFLIAASAVLAGKVPEGSEIKQIDVDRAVVVVRRGEIPHADNLSESAEK